jgi:hypothetical protein
MRQAAQELGQWVEKREETGTFSIIVEKLNAGRQRAARAAAKRRAERKRLQTGSLKIPPIESHDHGV